MGWEGQLKNAETFFSFYWAGFFSFLLLNTIFSRGYGEILAALDIYVCRLVYLPR